ncbi:hypothetical protein AB0E76_07085 [Streptomyces fungicidicus]|uniref:hypothetical protein n=1 Tax=Streptomyces fungicidicus TaxID=68203 RepID=UPI0033C6ABD5
MNDTPWYMRTVEPGTEGGSPESTRRTIESLASTASAEADAQVAHLKNLEAQGVEINPSTRMAMGYANVARKAAAQLGETTPNATSASTESITPEQRIARGYSA